MAEKFLVTLRHPFSIVETTIGVRRLGWSWFDAWDIACIGMLYIRELRQEQPDEK